MEAADETASGGMEKSARREMARLELERKKASVSGVEKIFRSGWEKLKGILANNRVVRKDGSDDLKVVELGEEVSEGETEVEVGTWLEDEGDIEVSEVQVETEEDRRSIRSDKVSTFGFLDKIVENN